MNIVKSTNQINNKLTRPRGPNLGAKAEAEPISPPVALRMTININ